MNGRTVADELSINPNSPPEEITSYQQILLRKVLCMLVYNKARGRLQVPAVFFGLFPDQLN